MTPSNNPYFTVWFQTKKTVVNVVQGKVRFRFYIPILLYGIVASWGFIGKATDKLFLLTYVITSISIVFIFSGYLIPWLVQITGRLWNGKSEFGNLQLVFGLAYIPFLILLTTQIIYFLVGDFRSMEEVNNMVQIIAWLFYIRILIIGIAKVQGFSYGFALLNFILAVLPFLVIRLLTL